MKKILIIDDDVLFLKVAAVLLKKQGYEVITLKNTNEVLRVALVEMPNLIVLDLVLPENNSLSALSDLKQHPGTNLIPVAVLANLETDGDINKIRQLGAAKYLIKSKITFREILQQIKPLLSNS